MGETKTVTSFSRVLAITVTTVDATDEDLMRAYCAGDEKAFRELFDRYAEPLFRAVQRLLADESAARDVVQQAFLQMHRARNDFAPTRKFRSWIYTIALNLARAERRRRGRRREDGLADEPRHASDDTPDQHVEAVQSRHRMAKAMERLSREQREVIILHWYEGLSFPAIAHATGAGLSAVKVRAHRAYKKLREFLPPDTS